MNAPATSETTPEIVAVAEDDDDLRELLCEVLRRDGHRVVELEDGLDLLDYMSFAQRLSMPRGVPAAVVTDVRMPGASGLDVVAWARLTGLSCPVIVLTAFADDEIQARAQQIGDVHVLSKPVELDVVTQAVREALARH